MKLSQTLGAKMTWSYIDILTDFVRTMNTRVNRVTKLSPAKVSKKDIPYLVSLTNSQSQKQLSKPKFKENDFVRIAKRDLPFRKGYKQNFTDEVFIVERVSTLNPPTYNLTDSNNEKIRGKFYESELIKVGEDGK